MAHITLVKKITADGHACAKCADVTERIARDGVGARIQRTVIADERDPDSEGMRLARAHGVERAPFFIVERPGEAAVVYTVYLALLREVLQHAGDEAEEAAEIAAALPDMAAI